MRIFVNGTFDILHPGHVQLLRYARSLGDYLLVAIDTDQRVTELKGSGRPFFSQTDRKFMLEALQYVDRVEMFSTDAELEYIIKTYAPDVMVKGSDYANRPIVGEQFVPEIDFFQRIDEYSSTKAIQHLATR